MKTTLLIEGPLIRSKPSNARIQIQRHRVTSSARWSIFSIDQHPETSDAFGKFISASSFEKDLTQFFKSKPYGPKGYISTGTRWGSAEKIKNTHFDTLIAIVQRHFTAAAEFVKNDPALQSERQRWDLGTDLERGR